MSTPSNNNTNRGGQRNNNHNNYRGRDRRRGRGRGRGRGRHRSKSRGRSRSRNRGRGRGRGRGHRGNRGRYRGRGRGRGHKTNNFRNARNEQYRNEKFQNELNLSYTPKDIKRFNAKWDRYTEKQTLSELICDIPFMTLRKEAIFQINKAMLQNSNNTQIIKTENETENTQIKSEKTENKTENIQIKTETNTDTNADNKVYIDGYEIGQNLKLTHIKTSILDEINVKHLGSLNWSHKQTENDTPSMENICAHLSIPATSIPLYKPPNLPFRMWRNKNEPTLPYTYPIRVPCSAIALSALKHNIDLSKYDFIGIRRSIKRILSFSDQLNTNFQCINGIIFATDVPISEKYFPYNYGYQMEVHCTDSMNNSAFENNIEIETKESEKQWPKPFRVIDSGNETRDDLILAEQKRKFSAFESENCVSVRKKCDYYHLIEVNICDLKLLLCAEIDCVDSEGKPMEIKFGSGDKLVSVWGQCLLSGIENVVRAQKTFQTLCTVVTGLSTFDRSHFYNSEKHRNAQLCVFYNVLKDIKDKLCKDQCKDEKSEYCVSDIYRLSRHRSHTQATLFKVGEGTQNLITKEDWQYLYQFQSNENNDVKVKCENKNEDSFDEPPMKKRKIDSK